MSEQSTVSPREIPIEDGEIEAVTVVRGAPPPLDAQGRVLRTVITPKDFLAGALGKDIVDGLAKSAVANLGTLAGEVYAVEKVTKDYSVGGETKALTSYWLSGVFRAVVAQTGEVFEAGQAILPKAYGVQAYNAFKDLGVTSLTMGVSIGLRKSTRTTIAYEWIVRDHMTAQAASRVAMISDKLGTMLGLDAPQPRKQIAS
jgi:hypothetical protein